MTFYKKVSYLCSNIEYCQIKHIKHIYIQLLTFNNSV